MSVSTPMVSPSDLEPEVVGPHSPWPRRRRFGPARIAGAAGAATAAVLAHCILPLL